MSSGPENRFIQGVHAKLTPRVYRMKNHNPYNSGIADCWYSGPSGDVWIEYKFIQIPKRLSTVVDITKGENPALSILQQQWLRGRFDEGRSVGVIIGSPDGGVWLPNLDFAKPLSTAELRSRLVSKKDLAALIADLVI